MSMPKYSKENLDEFINDYLKEDLKIMEQLINTYNDEIMEFIQLKNSINTLRDNTPNGFKTQVNIGGNMFIEAKVNDMSTIFLDAGKGIYIQFTLDEALKFIDKKIQTLEKECDKVRKESINKRCEIKVVLMYMGEQQNSKIAKQQNSTMQ